MFFETYIYTSIPYFFSNFSLFSFIDFSIIPSPFNWRPIRVLVSASPLTPTHIPKTAPFPSLKGISSIENQYENLDLKSL